VRGCPATDDYAPGLGRRNRLNQGLRRTADLCKHQRSSRPGQLATQSGNKLARANRYRLGADVTAYDYDRRLPLSHQPAGHSEIALDCRYPVERENSEVAVEIAFGLVGDGPHSLGSHCARCLSNSRRAIGSVSSKDNA